MIKIEKLFPVLLLTSMFFSCKNLKQKKPVPLICKSCEKEIKTEFVFCPFCGSSLTAQPISESANEKMKMISSVKELEGLWLYDTGKEKICLEYPFYTDYENFWFLIAFEREDATEIWKNYAARENLDFSDVWEKRNSYKDYIHGPVLNGKNGVQKGYILSMENSCIYMQNQILIPYEILVHNMDCFRISEDKSTLELDGQFNMYEPKIKNLEFKELSFRKMNNQS